MTWVVLASYLYQLKWYEVNELCGKYVKYFHNMSMLGSLCKVQVILQSMIWWKFNLTNLNCLTKSDIDFVSEPTARSVFCWPFSSDYERPLATFTKYGVTLRKSGHDKNRECWGRLLQSRCQTLTTDHTKILGSS